MLRILIGAEIRQDSTGAVLGLDRGGDFPDDGENAMHGGFVELSEVGE
jgi:hypothetical protein